MFDTRWYKIFYDLVGNKTRTLLIILSIAVGLFAVGAIISARDILSTDMARSYATINPSSGVVRTIELFDTDFIHAMHSVKGVKDVEARRTIDVRARIGTGDWFDFKIFVVDDYNKMKVNKILPEAGAWPPPDKQILIERSAMPIFNASIGDVLTIELPNDQHRDLRIGGTTHDMAQLPAQIDVTPYGYISFKTVDWLGMPYGFNELDIISANQATKAAAQEVINRVKDRAEANGYTIPLSMTAEPGQLPLNDILQAILVLMGLLGVLSLFLSIFLIINTITALLAQQKRQIGVMKAVGANSLQLVKMYLGMVMIYGLTALLISIPLSAFGAGFLSQVMAGFFNFDISNTQISPLAVVVQVMTGILIPVMASLYPFLLNLRISAAEALSIFGQGGQLSRKNPIDRLLSGANLWFARHILVRPLLLSLRNTFRSKGRLVLTLITLSMAGAIFISVFNVRTSIFDTMDSLMRLWHFDVMVNFDNNYPVEKIESEAEKMPHVTAVDIWIQVPARLVRPDGTESEAIYMFAPNAASDLARSPEIIAGRWITPGDENGLVVNSLFLKNEGVKLGDTITIKLDGRKFHFQIIGVTLGIAESMFYANYPYIAKITNATGKANTALVTFDDLSGEDLAQAVEGLQNHFKKQGLHVAGSQTVADEKEQNQSTFDVVILLLMVMAALLALVGGLGLMGTMSINVLERTREIGVLRAIGAPNRGVSQVFMQEGVAIGIISWFLGILMSVPFSLVLDNAIGLPLIGSALQLSYSYEGACAWLIIVIGLSILASGLPARSASHLTVREVLAYE